MPNQEYYPLPTEYLFLPEFDLALWDFLYYKAVQNDGWAVFKLAEVFHDPRLIQNRNNLKPWLHAQQSKELLRIDKEAHGRKKQYLIKLLPWQESRQPRVLKPIGFHQNGWVHELLSPEEHWLLNLFLIHELNQDKQRQPKLTLTVPQLQSLIQEQVGSQLREQIQLETNKKDKKTKKQVLKKILCLTNKKLNQPSNILHGLVRLQLITHHGHSFQLNRQTFLRPAAVRDIEKIRHDLTAQRRIIATYLSRALLRKIDTSQEIVELIRYWHQVGGLPQRKFVNAYSQLSWAKKAKEINLEKLSDHLKWRTSDRRDRTTRYKKVLKDFRCQSQKPLPDFSNQLKLRLDHHTLVGGSFYFDPPLARRPMSLTLRTIPRWPIRHLPPQKEELTLLIWVEGHEPIEVARLFSDHKGPLNKLLMGKLPARYNLATPLTLLIQSPRPLEGLTVNAILEVILD